MLATKKDAWWAAIPPQIQFLVRELRSYMPLSHKTKTKQKQYCNKFNKDFKKWSYPKKNLKKKIFKKPKT